MIYFYPRHLPAAATSTCESRLATFRHTQSDLSSNDDNDGVTEVTRISVQPLYFRNHTPTVLYNQKNKEYEITKNVEISTK